MRETWCPIPDFTLKSWTSTMFRNPSEAPRRYWSKIVISAIRVVYGIAWFRIGLQISFWSSLFQPPNSHFTLNSWKKNHKYYNERRLRETWCPIPDFTLKSWIHNHKYYTNITTKSTSDSKFVLRMQFKKCEFSKIVIKNWNEQLISFFDFDQTFSISIFNHDFWEYDSKQMNSQKSWLKIETNTN